MFSRFAKEEDCSERRHANNELWGGAMKVLSAYETTSDVDDLEEVLSRMFGKPAPPKEEILRHKWFESEKAGCDVGVLAAAHDWRVKYYAHWKEIHASSTETVTPRAGSVSRRRLEMLAAYVLLPLAALLFGLALLQWATGIDYTDYISGPKFKRLDR